MKIALISCSKEKKDYPCPARELYSASTLFSLSYAYAKQRADKIYILSAKYGLVSEDRILEPYNQTLNEMSRTEQLNWASRVLRALQKECDLTVDHFVILAGNNYCKDLVSSLPNCELPLAGMPLGKRIAFLKSQLESDNKPMCLRLHELFCAMPRYTSDQISEIPFTNGIYIVFEKGEQYHNMERIVRVGTHTSPDRLKKRLTDHFAKENHDGSIFRKNIGKAILNAYHDPYLPVWTLDTSKPENRKYVNAEKNADTERRVSKYLRENFTFTVFQVDTKEERLRLEEAIIASLNQTPDFLPGKRWAGKYSPEHEIRESGLWLKQGLDGTPLSEQEYNRLLTLCGRRQDVGSYTKTVAISAVHTKTATAPAVTNRTVGIGKYEPLHQYFLSQQDMRLTLSFAEIEAILGFTLPKSAYTYPMWWNPSATHTQCLSWTKAGYRAVNVSEGIRTKRMTFEKVHL